jgi:hypothetical protein
VDSGKSRAIRVLRAPPDSPDQHVHSHPHFQVHFHVHDHSPSLDLVLAAHPAVAAEHKIGEIDLDRKKPAILSATIPRSTSCGLTP